MTVTLASDLIDQARIALEAAAAHMRSAGEPTCPQEASNLAAAYRTYQLMLEATKPVGGWLEALLPPGRYEFDDGVVIRGNGLPRWTTDVRERQRIYPFERWGEGHRPTRWQSDLGWERS